MSRRAGGHCRTRHGKAETDDASTGSSASVPAPYFFDKQISLLVTELGDVIFVPWVTSSE